MNEISKYGVVALAYKSRFLFRTDSEYRKALGVSFETVNSNKESARDMEVYYELLNRKVHPLSDESLKDTMDEYLFASKVYTDLDWRERTQLASRKRFCRMLFRFVATAGKALTNDEVFKFKIKDGDKRLIDLFFPDGVEREPAVHVEWMLLFAFGVIRPWSGENSRSRDISDRETMAQLEKFHRLIGDLREDMPRLGNLEKPLAIDELLYIINYRMEPDVSREEIVPMWFRQTLRMVKDSCRRLAIPEQIREESEELGSVYMPGIWIDDFDKGETRFWIFPDNYLMAFCYRLDGSASWELDPYEIRVRFSSHPDYSDSFLMVTPEGNRSFICSPEKVTELASIAFGVCDMEYDPESLECISMSLDSDTGDFPSWLSWRRWIRLDMEDPLYKKFRKVLDDIYNPESPFSSLFRNVAPEITDLMDCVAGRDRKYIYLYDAGSKRFRIRERETGHFEYEALKQGENGEKALFELNVSESHPLYALPVKTQRKRFVNKELEKLALMMEDASHIDHAYIIRSSFSKFPRLFFPAHIVSVALNMEELKEFGVLKFTRNPF